MAAAKASDGEGKAILKWQDTVASVQATNKAEKPKGASNAAQAAEKLNKTVVLTATTWDTFSPPPSNSFKVT